MNIYTNAYVYKYILDFWSIKKYLPAELIENTTFKEKTQYLMNTL